MTDPAQIQYLNARYVNVPNPMLVVVNNTPGSSQSIPLLLIQDQNTDNQNVVVQEGVPFWVTWTALYQDQMDLYYCAAGVNTLSNSISNYTVYQPDGVTTIDLSTSTIYPIASGGGPDPLSRDTQEIFINYSFTGGMTYFASFIPLVSGSVGIYIYGD